MLGAPVCHRGGMARTVLVESARQRIEQVDRTDDLLVLESTWQPRGGPPPAHWHPRQEERFEVLEGELTVVLGAAPPRVVRAGERFVVRPRTVHRMWNASDAVTRASWEVTPAQRTAEMMRSRASGGGALQVPVLLWRFRHEFRIGPVLGRR